MITRKQMQQLIRELSSKNESTRILAAGSLGGHGQDVLKFGKIGIGALIKAIDDKSEKVRAAAICALRNTITKSNGEGYRKICEMEKRLMPIFIKALDDKNGEVVEEAATAIDWMHIDISKAIPKLVERMDYAPREIVHVLRSALENEQTKENTRKCLCEALLEGDEWKHGIVIEGILSNKRGEGTAHLTEVEIGVDIGFALPTLAIVFEKGNEETQRMILELLKDAVGNYKNRENTAEIVGLMAEAIASEHEEIRMEAIHFFEHRRGFSSAIAEKIDLEKLRESLAKFVEKESSKSKAKGIAAQGTSTGLYNWILEIVVGTKDSMRGVLSDGKPRIPPNNSKKVFRSHRVGAR